MTPDDVVKAARSALGVKFLHQGRHPQTGLDCAGLVAYVATTLGIDHTDQTVYSRLPSGGLLESALDGQSCLCSVLGEPQAGDVLLMRFGREPQHLAICAGETVVHSYAEIGMVCEHRISDIWRRRIVRVYRFKGLSNE